MVPFAPKLSTVFIACPATKQVAVDGGDGYCADPMTWMGNEAATSPDIVMSTMPVGPQAYPSANSAHSKMELLLASTCGVNAAASAGASTDPMMRSPLAPVSIAMSSITWQLVVLPGAQIFTDVYSAFRLISGPGPALTIAVATLLAALAMVLDPAALVAVLELFDLWHEAPIRIAVPNFMADT